MSLKKVIDVCRAQDWEMVLSRDGKQWSAKPPAGTDVIRFSAVSLDLTLVIRELRQHGLKWPPPEERAPEPKISATPFPPPKANPHVTVTREEASPPPEPATSAALSDPDRLYTELRDARLYEQAALEELTKSREVLAESQARVDADTREYEIAKSKRAAIKAAFDAAFGD